MDSRPSIISMSLYFMTVPLMILAVLSVVGGYVGLPHIFGVSNYFEEWLVLSLPEAVLAEHALAVRWGDTGLETTP